jgi:regulator of sirC expression with transglutaminase-like and TPR domain
VQAIVRWANAQGGAGAIRRAHRLSAAAVAANGEVVVAFDYMNQILDFNAFDRTVVCQPGVVTRQLQTSPKKTACITRWTSLPAVPARLAAISAPMPAGSR